MKIVIDIPEEKYNYVKKQVAEGIDNPLKVYIAKGTPLPNGRGDVVLRQAVSDNIKNRLWQTALNNSDYITSYAKVCEDIAENRIDTWIEEVKGWQETV